jgi:hypothetical protein
MTSSLRFAHVVAAQSDPMLARLTLDSIRLQDRSSDLVVLVADSQQRHAFGPAALALEAGLAAVEYIYLPAASYGSATLGALYLEGLRTVARRADVAIFCREGLLFRPDHLRATERDFEAAADLVGVLEMANDIVDIDVTTPPKDASSILGSSSSRQGLRRLARRWLVPRLASGYALSARIAVVAGLSFHRFSERFDWIEFSRFIEGLEPRGRTLTTSTASIVNLRRVSDRRSGFDSGHQAYRALAALVDDANGRPMPARSEMIRLGVHHATRAMLDPAERNWSLSFLRGMWSARVATRSTRKAVARDLHDLV